MPVHTPPTTQPRVKLVDPQNMIARIRERLNSKCAVRVSPYCDVIISMRMQGIDFRGIEKWLRSQGEQFRISAPTIYRNLAHTKMHVRMTYAEEMLENLGGEVVELDLIREMSNNVRLQKERVDGMVRAEQQIREQPGKAGHSDRRIRHELEVYNEMLKNLHTVLADVPAKAQEAAVAEQKRLDSQTLSVTADAVTVIRDLILNNELTVGMGDALPAGPVRH